MAATGPSSPDTTKETSSASAAAATEAVKGAANANDAAAAAPSSAAASADVAKGDATKTAAAATATTTAMPTYLTTKNSKAYKLAKQLLSSGQLDDALSTLEMTLQLSRQMLANSMNRDSEEDGADVELHESLAPLYYMYGTTLLYSVEESDVMMANGKPAGDAAVGDVEVPPAENESGQKQPSAENNDQNEEEEEAPAVADPTEDLQIAWENLDLARSIVSHLVQDFHSPNSSNSNAIILKSNTKNDNETSPEKEYTPSEQTELLLDLAQIHTRLGDLQRANDNMLPCLEDYNLALQLRCKCLGKFDRKVADGHFSLAAAYAEAPNRVGEREGMVDQFVSSLSGGAGGDAGAASAGGGEDSGGLSEHEKMEFRQRSLEHYLACGVAFAGLMAEMCGEDADKLTSLVCQEGTSTAAAAFASAASSASNNINNSSTNFSKSMSTLRQRLSNLQPPASQKAEFDDLKEMLDEIQEAIDTAEETEEGLKSLGEMKANEIKKHEMKQSNQNENGVEEGGADGAITTIGFGSGAAASLSASAATTAAAAATAVNAFGASTATLATAAAAAPTMMVVKKKKKKPQATTDGEGAAAKRLKADN